MFLALFERLDNLISDFVSVLSLLNKVGIILWFEELSKPSNGIIFLSPFLSLTLRPVKCRVIRSRMVSHSVGHELNEIWFFLVDYIISCFFSCLKTSKSIISVYSSTCNTHRNNSWDNTIRGVLISGWRGDSVLVVSAEEKSLAFESSSEVKCDGEIALTGSAFTQIASNNLLIIIHSECIAWTCSLWDLSSFNNQQFILSGDDTVTLPNSLEPKCIGICLPLEVSWLFPMHWLIMWSIV